jgi:hypothetical protein
MRPDPDARSARYCCAGPTCSVVSNLCPMSKIREVPATLARVHDVHDVHDKSEIREENSHTPSPVYPLPLSPSAIPSKVPGHHGHHGHVPCWQALLASDRARSRIGHHGHHGHVHPAGSSNFQPSKFPILHRNKHIARLWLRCERIPAFGGLTAEQLVRAGKASAVSDYLDGIEHGGLTRFGLMVQGGQTRAMGIEPPAVPDGGTSVPP